MYTTSTAYKTEIQKRSRTFECRVTIGDRVFTNNEVQSIDLNGGIQDVFSIGNTPSMCLELVLRNTTDTIFTTNSVKVEIGLKIVSTIEYVPLGIFNVEDIKKDDYTTKFTCYDNMTKFEIAYFSSLGDNPTLQQVVNELATKTGVQFTGTLPAYNVKKLEGFTCREVLGYVASLCGGNALITRDGNFTIVYPTDISRDVGEGVFDLQRDEVKYKVGKITCQVKEQETISKGSLGTDNMELSFENPWVTETILTDIYNRLNGFNYLGYTMKWQGDLSLDIGDVITYTDVKGVTRKLPILYRKLSYDGGLDSELSAKGETKNKNSFNSSGSMSNKVNRLVTEQAVIKEALIEKANIEDLKATNAEISNLKVKDAEIENALIKKATIEQLNATNANIQNLIAEDARINNLVASKASITELNAVSAKIGTVEADTAIIKDLLAGNVTAGSGQIIHLTAKNVTIEDAVIKNLIAAKLSVSDLQAGTISTNKFSISSTDGGLNIVGPTIQWKDKNNKIRMQAGKDAQGNFTFLLVGEDGSTALLDQTGIKKGAIANDLIVSDMISENAIGEKQINYSSLITGLNKDDNTSLIKASKVAIDLTGQSLEVAFNSLKSNVDNMEIGGRNLILNSSKCNISSISKASKNLELKKDIVEYLNNHIGENVIASCNVDVTNIKTATGDYGLRMGMQISVRYIDDTTGFIQAWYAGIVGSSKKGRIKGKPVKIKKEIKAISGGIYIQVTSDECMVSYPKFELGDKATDWTPAPEDVEEVTQNLQTQITVAQGKIEGLIRDTTITEGSTSTSLKDSYISLKATVNGLNSTVASHTSSISTVTTELGKVDGKINTAKSDAISTAGADATSKANNALNSAKSYTNAQITTVNTRVSNAESSITQLNNSITNKVWQTDIDKTVSKIEIGGRNLLQGSDKIVGEVSKREFVQFADVAPIFDKYGLIEYTISFDIKSKDTSKTNSVLVYGQSDSGSKYVFSGTVFVSTEWQRLSITVTPVLSDYDTSTAMLAFFGTYDTGNIPIIKNVKIEKGNKATDWTPAPEDVDESILAVSKEVTTVKEKAASLETNLNGITSKVTNLESTTSTINGKVNAQETRLQSTEQKVTATGVITTITEAINAGTNSLTTMQFILDKNGATIKNGALRILNKAGVEVLKGDSDGNLIMTGTINILSKSKTYSIAKIWGTEYNGSGYTEYLHDGDFALCIKDSKDLQGFKKSVLERSTVGGKEKVVINAGSYLNLHAGDILGNGAPSYTGIASFGVKIPFGDGSTTTNDIMVTDKAMYFGTGTNKVFNLSVGLNTSNNEGFRVTYNGYDLFRITGKNGGESYFGYNPIYFDRNVTAMYNFTVKGTKSCLEETKNYGAVRSFAVESPSDWRIDYYFGKTDENGECVVYLDDVFIEYANTDMRYGVSIQEEGDGILYPCEYTTTWFKVKGTPNLKFNCEVRALRRGFENNRNLRHVNVEEEYINLSTVEEELNDNIEDILLN